MIFLLNDLTSGECIVFYNRKDLDFWVSENAIGKGEIEDYCYFSLPDDFCIPVRYLDNTMLIMDALAAMGYESISLRDG